LTAVSLTRRRRCAFAIQNSDQCLRRTKRIHRGSTVNVAVKSGTNDLARFVVLLQPSGRFNRQQLFSNRAVKNVRAQLLSRGGQVNGPIYIPYLYNGRDKTFFMFSYEKQLDKRAEPETFTVPTA
jgi:hypothetical protein